MIEGRCEDLRMGRSLARPTLLIDTRAAERCACMCEECLLPCFLAKFLQVSKTLSGVRSACPRPTGKKQGGTHRKVPGIAYYAMVEVFPLLCLAAMHSVPFLSKSSR